MEKERGGERGEKEREGEREREREKEREGVSGGDEKGVTSGGINLAILAPDRVHVRFDHCLQGWIQSEVYLNICRVKLNLRLNRWRSLKSNSVPFYSDLHVRVDSVRNQQTCMLNSD